MVMRKLDLYFVKLNIELMQFFYNNIPGLSKREFLEENYKFVQFAHL